MSADSWQRARLISIAGIKSPAEQEQRATSALLAVLVAVKEFGRAITQPLGAPSGAIETFIEVPLHLNSHRCVPDGLIRVQRGKRIWTALVEVKTGRNRLDKAQVETYLDVAKQEGFDAVLTVSNEIATVPGRHPVSVAPQKIKRVALYHLSWTRILTEAVLQKSFRGVEDPDQAWILGELIRYLEAPQSGAMDFKDMGRHWVPIRRGARAGTLRGKDKLAAVEVASRWDQLIHYAALRLGRELGADVQPLLSKHDRTAPEARVSRLADGLIGNGRLHGGIRIPDAVGPVELGVDLRSGQLELSVQLDAPDSGRAATRVNWLVRQLKDAPEGLRIDAAARHARETTSALLRDVREDPAVLIDNGKSDLRRFTVALIAPIGTKGGEGPGTFIDSVLTSLDGFYVTVIQNLRAWTRPAPKLKRVEPVDAPGAAEEAGPIPETLTPMDDRSTKEHVRGADDVPALHRRPDESAHIRSAEPRSEEEQSSDQQLTSALAGLPQPDGPLRDDSASASDGVPDHFAL